MIEQAQNLALQGGDTRRKLPQGKAFEPSPHTVSYRPEGYGPFGPRWPEIGGSSVRPSRKRAVPLVGTKTKRRASASDTSNSESVDAPFRFRRNRNDGAERGEDRSTGGVALPAVYPWPRGSRSGIPIPTATVDRKPAKTQPSALQCGRGKPRPSGRGGCHIFWNVH